MHKHGWAGATPVNNYLTTQGLRLVSASDIIVVLWAETTQDGAARLEFAPEDIGTHSLNSGRAMDMYIVGFPDRTLMTIGRWRFLGFMAYIQHIYHPSVQASR